MSRREYRLEPLLRLCERRLGLTRRRVADASREVSARQEALSGLGERADAATRFALRASQADELDSPSVRAVAGSRAEALLAAASAAREEAGRERRRLHGAIAGRSRLAAEAREAEGDAVLQRNARDKAMALARLRRRRREERAEAECALETWLSMRRDVEEESDRAS